MSETNVEGFGAQQACVRHAFGGRYSALSCWSSSSFFLLLSNHTMESPQCYYIQIGEINEIGGTRGGRGEIIRQSDGRHQSSTPSIEAKAASFDLEDDDDLIEGLIGLEQLC